MKVKEKLKAMAGAVAEIEKQFGRGSVMYLGMSPSSENIPTFSTGSLRLDKAIGVGGYPRGRIIEIYGPESSGKTTLTLHAISEIQRVGGSCAFIDAEHALDVTYARRLGVDVDSLLVSQPDHGEQALAITDILIHSGGVDLVVIDSVAALVPKAELEGDMGDHHVGLQARMMSKAMRKLTAITHRTGSTIIFINQIRQKIGVSFGSPETTSGGNALKFFSSVRLDIRRIGKIKDSSETIGNQTRVRVVKNKLAPPFKEAVFEIRFGEGISRYGELLDLGLECGAIEKAGSWLSLGGERLGQGKEKAIERLKTDPALLENLEKAIKHGGTDHVSSEKKETKDDHKAA